MCLFNYWGCSYANNGIRGNVRPLLSSSHAKIAREFQIILELVSWRLRQNVLWEVLSFHLGLKFSTYQSILQ